VAALKVKHKSSSGNNVLKGFLGIAVRTITLLLDKVSKVIFFSLL
jgi:hypothetical protein